MNKKTITTRPKVKLWRLTWRRYRRSKLGLLGLGIVLAIFLVAFFAPLLANRNPIACKYKGKVYCPALVEMAQNTPLAGRFVKMPKPFRFPAFDYKGEVADGMAEGDWAVWPPVPYGPLETVGEFLQPPSHAHPFGTDEVGRDVLARMIYGAGVSMKVGFISMGIAVVIGLILGATAGYFGGWSDILISRFIEIVMCFPTFFLILAILAWLPPRIENVMIVIGLTGWTGIARYARGECIKLRRQDYVLAARAMGASHLRVILRHIIPNSLAPVMVSVTFGIASAILVEAGLSWLGFGVQTPKPSWGNILRAGYDNLFTAPHMIPSPCVAIFLAVLAFNLVGDRMRDVTDPRLQSSDN